MPSKTRGRKGSPIGEVKDQRVQAVQRVAVRTPNAEPQTNDEVEKWSPVARPKQA